MMCLALIPTSIWALDCDPVSPGDVYPPTIEKMYALFDLPPTTVLDCGPALTRLIEGVWANYDSDGVWAKSGIARCWIETWKGETDTWCGRTITVSNSATGDKIRFIHEMPYERIDEIVRTVKPLISEQDRIVEIKYVRVYGGGAWSVEEYGYQAVVEKNDSPTANREHFVIVKDCSPSPCMWTVKSRQLSMVVF